MLARDRHRLGLGRERAREHVQPRDVVRRQGEHPLAGAAERRLARGRVGEQGVGRQRDALRAGPSIRSSRRRGRSAARRSPAGRPGRRRRRSTTRIASPPASASRSAARTPSPGGTTRSASPSPRRRVGRGLTIRPAHSGRTAARAGCRARRRRPRRCRRPVPHRLTIAITPKHDSGRAETRSRHRRRSSSTASGCGRRQLDARPPSRRASARREHARDDARPAARAAHAAHDRHPRGETSIRRLELRRAAAGRLGRCSARSAIGSSTRPAYVERARG